EQHPRQPRGLPRRHPTPRRARGGGRDPGPRGSAARDHRDVVDLGLARPAPGAGVPARGRPGVRGRGGQRHLRAQRARRRPRLHRDRAVAGHRRAAQPRPARPGAAPAGPGHGRPAGGRRAAGPGVHRGRAPPRRRPRDRRRRGRRDERARPGGRRGAETAAVLRPRVPHAGARPRL
ncbi:MAG: hypothetical protein AVDCRST_MAG35-1696, partial [uncultured Quadrisphaera sp.]